MKFWSKFKNMHRDPRYIVVALVALVTLYASTKFATDTEGVSELETAIFNSINLLPEVSRYFFYVVTQLGSFASVIVWLPAAYLIAGRYLLLKSSLAITLTYFAAKFMKLSIGRGRPADFYDTLNVFDVEKFSGFGFPSGHSALAATAAFTLVYSVRPKYRKHILLLALLVGISRISLGGHLPLDVVGGWALGAVVASLVSLVFGRKQTKYKKMPVLNSLKRAGYKVNSLTFLNTDAKSSTPFILKTAKGGFLGKIHGEDDYINSWAFRLYRKVKYKKVSDEEPFLNIKRQLTNEGFASYIARKNGVRTPEVTDIVKHGNSWILLQEYIDGVSLAEYPAAKLKDSHLLDLWKQVKLLQQSGIAHRDLRSENILINNKGKSLLIDFGFAEIAANQRRKYIDLAEVLVSVGLKVGAEKAVKSFSKVFEQRDLENVILYIQYSALSSTTKIKAKKDDSIISHLKKQLESHIGEGFSYTQKELKRFPTSKIINYITLVLFAIIGIPQFEEFSKGLSELSDINAGFVVVALTASLGTYVFSGLALEALAKHPLSKVKSILQYVASSYFGRFLPKGAGSAAVGYQFLRKSGFSKPDAISTTLVLRLVGFVTFIVPVIVFLLVRGSTLQDAFNFNVSRWHVLLGIFLLVSAIIFFKVSNHKARKLKKLAAETRNALMDLRDAKSSLYRGVFYSTLISVSYILALYFSMLAAGSFNSPFLAVLSFSVASIAATAAPTPGGLGAMEITMIAVMTSFGLDKGVAFNAVVIYRLLTFWLPIPFGYVSYLYLKKEKAL